MSDSINLHTLSWCAENTSAVYTSINNILQLPIFLNIRFNTSISGFLTRSDIEQRVLRRTESLQVSPQVKHLFISLTLVSFIQSKNYPACRVKGKLTAPHPSHKLAHATLTTLFRGRVKSQSKILFNFKKNVDGNLREKTPSIVECKCLATPMKWVESRTTHVLLFILAAIIPTSLLLITQNLQKMNTFAGRIRITWLNRNERASEFHHPAILVVHVYRWNCQRKRRETNVNRHEPRTLLQSLETSLRLLLDFQHFYQDATVEQAFYTRV